MKYIILILLISQITYSQPENPGEYKAGWTSITLNRNGRTLNCRVYYPAITEGSNTQIDTLHAPYQVIGFGHGFFMQTGYYLSLFKHLATYGYVVIAPQFPDTQHGELADDLLYCVNFIKQQNTNPLSIYYNLIDTTKSGLFGHSMGGGASLLAASRDSSITVAAPLAAAETNPSAIAAMSLIKGVVYLIAAQNDGITPVNTNQALMYNNAFPIKALPIIKGGNHTKFMDVSIWDWTDPNGYITRSEQLRLTRKYLASVFNLFLKEDTSFFHYAFGNKITNDPNMIFTSMLKPLAPKSFDLISPNDTLISSPQNFTWQSTYSLNLFDSVKYSLIISTDSLMSDTFFVKETGIDTSVALTLQSGKYFGRVKAYTSDSTFKFSNQNYTFTVGNAFVLNLTVLIEGLYDNNFMTQDTIQVELRNSFMPYTLTDYGKKVLDSTGNVSFSFSSVENTESYFIVVRHRNAVETWSASSLSFTSGILNYDFTTAQNKAYGNNMVRKGTSWCVYSGDVNQDGIVDIADLVLVDNDNYSFVTGYLPTDINGDGIVDVTDLVLVDYNSLNYVSKVTPSTLILRKDMKDNEIIRRNGE